VSGKNGKKGKENLKLTRITEDKREGGVAVAPNESAGTTKKWQQQPPGWGLFSF
jgi:hypothetical protein